MQQFQDISLARTPFYALLAGQRNQAFGCEVFASKPFLPSGAITLLDVSTE